jgi:hypothetical protein
MNEKRMGMFFFFFLISKNGDVIHVILLLDSDDGALLLVTDIIKIEVACIAYGIACGTIALIQDFYFK